MPQTGRSSDSAALLRRALQLHQNGRLADCAQECRQLLNLQPGHVGALHLLGVVRAQEGAYEEAAGLLSDALAQHPHHPEMLNHFGNVLRNLGRAAEAAEQHRAALRRKPYYAEAMLGLGHALRALGRPGDAVSQYQAALRRQPRLLPARLGLAAARMDLGSWREAEELSRALLAEHPTLPEAALTLGLALAAGGRAAEAEAAFRRALLLRPGFAEAEAELGNLLREVRPAEAEGCYRRAVALRPTLAVVHANLGVLLRRRGDRAAAIQHTRRVVALKPDDAAAHRDLAVALRDIGRQQEALAHAEWAVQLDPRDTIAQLTRSGLLQRRGDVAAAAAALRDGLEHQPDDAELLRALADALTPIDLDGAIVACRRALKVDPSHGWALCKLYQLLRKRGAWEDAAALDESIDAFSAAALAAGTLPESPLLSIARHDDMRRHLAIAAAWGRDAASRAPERPPGAAGPRGSTRLRIGYLSGDFRDHPVSHLARGLFALHDRDSFDIHAFSYGPDDGDPYRGHIAATCEHFIDIAGLDDAEAVEKIAASRIDILVDLTGHTHGTRLEIAAARPAPLQVSYLGYPGTTGAAYFDYIVADHVVLPDDALAAFSEAPIRLPYCYAVTDRGQRIGAVPTRNEVGLPAQGPVLCSFNDWSKVSRPLFLLWLNILRDLPAATLMLRNHGETTGARLRALAAAHGIAGERLIFVDRYRDKAMHLARLSVADLALDTDHYNGHATTVDALWAGLPVIGFEGRQFANRVSSSMLQAVGMPELITRDHAAYQRLAVMLAGDPGRLAETRAKLAAARDNCPLFDTPRWVRDIERAYRAIWQRRIAGEKPSLLDLTPEARGAGMDPQNVM
jgi:predicted O-linked N-acetylglucosamine transferase (SPINDLY family)